MTLLDFSIRRAFLAVTLLLVTDKTVCRYQKQSSSPHLSPGVGKQYELKDDTPAAFKHSAQNLTVGPGDRAVLKCKVDNLGTRTVTWRRFGETHPLTIGLFPFAPDVRLSVDFSQRTNEWSLVIQDVNPEDEGIYICQVTAKDDLDNAHYVRLNVRTVQLSGTGYVELGSPIRLLCNVSGKPEPPYNVEWLRNGLKVQSDAFNGVFVTKKIELKTLISVLDIKISRSYDAGDYTCQSSNGDSSTITVHVINDFLMNHRINNKVISAERITGNQHSSSVGLLRRTDSFLQLTIALTIATTNTKPTSGWFCR